MSADRAVVLAVVVLLGLGGLLGMSGMIWLIDHDRDATAIAAIGTLTGGAFGALGALLASTRTTTSVAAEAKAQGYQEAVAHVETLGAATAVPVEVVNVDANPVPVAETAP